MGGGYITTFAVSMGPKHNEEMDPIESKILEKWGVNKI